MKLSNIKTGFYTDGEKLYSKIDGNICVWMPHREESDLQLKNGTDVAKVKCSDLEIEVKPVKEGMSFCGGEIEVINKTVISGIEIHPINPVYDKKGYCVKHDGYKELKCYCNFKFEAVTEDGRRRYRCY